MAGLGAREAIEAGAAEAADRTGISALASMARARVPGSGDPGAGATGWEQELTQKTAAF